MANGFGPDLAGLAAFAGARENILARREEQRLQKINEEAFKTFHDVDTLEAGIVKENAFKRASAVSTEVDKLRAAGVAPDQLTEFGNKAGKDAYRVLGIKSIKYNTVYNNIQTVTKADGTEEHYFTNALGEEKLFKVGESAAIAAARLKGVGAGTAKAIEAQAGALRDALKITRTRIADLQVEGKGVLRTGLLIKTSDFLALEPNTRALYEDEYRDEMVLNTLADPTFKLYSIASAELKTRAEQASAQLGREVKPEELLYTYRNDFGLNIVVDNVASGTTPFGERRGARDTRIQEESQKLLAALKKNGQVQGLPKNPGEAEPNPTPEDQVTAEDSQLRAAIDPGGGALEFQVQRAQQFGEDVRSRFGGPSLRRPTVQPGPR